MSACNFYALCELLWFLSEGTALPGCHKDGWLGCVRIKTVCIVTVTAFVKLNQDLMNYGHLIIVCILKEPRMCQAWFTKDNGKDSTWKKLYLEYACSAVNAVSVLQKDGVGRFQPAIAGAVRTIVIAAAQSSGRAATVYKKLDKYCAQQGWTLCWHPVKSRKTKAELSSSP